MKKLLLALILLFPISAHAEGYVRAELVSPPVNNGGVVKFKLTVAATGKPLKESELALVHTQQIHLLIVDAALEDYQHVHPTATATPGVYQFEFTPRKSQQDAKFYRAFADVTPLATGQEEFAEFTIGQETQPLPEINKTVYYKTFVNGLEFDLTLDAPLQAGGMANGRITLMKGGQLYNGLQPLMGAFAHITAFGENGHDVIHVHPMSGEPQGDADRGGPYLEFNIRPEHPGFVKLFVQTKVDGLETYAPFGLMVAAAGYNQPASNQPPMSMPVAAPQPQPSQTEIVPQQQIRVNSQSGTLPALPTNNPPVYDAPPPAPANPYQPSDSQIMNAPSSGELTPPISH